VTVPVDFEEAAEALRPDRELPERHLSEAAALIALRRHGQAGKLLREYLKSHSQDVRALHLLADNMARQNRIGEALGVLARAIAAEPGLPAPRYAFAELLLKANKPQDARAEADTLLADEPANPMFRKLKATTLEALEDHDAAAAVWRALTDDYPDEIELWLRYGHALRAKGAADEAIAAYRKAIEFAPGLGAAWWALADMKTFSFEEADILAMESQQHSAPPSERARLHFALGKAYGDLAQYDTSFVHYAKANALQRQTLHHDAEVLSSYVARCKRVFTPALLRERAGLGCRNGDPIFVVGMARAGSTLVEQILASHSQIEGTRELTDLAALSRHIQAELGSSVGTDYPQVLAMLDGATLESLGERYVQTTRAHRKTGRSRFTDKMGPNFVHVGLIKLILPNAKIVDVRRHPLACGFSIFAQLFPRGENHAYRLADIGRLYRDYVDLMAHFDRAAPGAVHRVLYEALVADPESQIRRLLDYLGLPFEAACLDFHKTERVVTTVSAEQVRRPLYREALEQWRHYELWLGPLKEALGPVLDAYPHAPEA
jgi:tetratricopeptide (TPR) repeat protein